MGPRLSFSCCCIKINVSASCIKQGAFDLEWPVDDLIDIKCQLFESVSFIVFCLQRVHTHMYVCMCTCINSVIPDVYFLQSGTVIMKLSVISSNANQSNHVCGTSG